MTLPPPLSWLWAGWMKLSHAIGFVMSKILLTILWIVGFGLYGIILKIVTAMKKGPAYRGEWIDATPSTTETMKRLF